MSYRSIGLRKRQPTDMPEIIAIDAQSYETPPTEEDYNRIPAYRHLVAYQETGEVKEALRVERVVASMTFGFTQDGIILTSLAVHPRHRRRGVGRWMMMNLLKLLQANKRHTISAAVAEHNLPAQLFLRECGLKAEYIVRDYWDCPHDPLDAYVFTHDVRGFRPHNRMKAYFQS